MNLEAQLTALKTQNRNLPLSERATLSCRLAKQLEKIGKYELAYEALSEFWPNQDESPHLDGLDETQKAEVLLRIGALAQWLGSTDQTEGGQEAAKNILTRSIEIFEGLQKSVKVSEARGDLALCYQREGAFDEARVQLKTALHILPEGNDDLEAILLIRAGIIEERTRRFNDALQYYKRAAPLVERSDDHAIKGSFHFSYGHVLGWLAAPENRQDYVDQALIEYAASSFHYGQAGNELALARVELNLGFLFFKVRRYDQAHEHLDIARHLFLKLKDSATAAQVDDTRARTLLAQGYAVEAERIARQAVRALERGDQQALLAEGLTTHGITLARLGNHIRARAMLERAIEVAETVGDVEGAGRAKLSIIEEFGDKISGKELITIYRSAIDSLRTSQDPGTGKRLITCADTLLETIDRLELQESAKREEPSWQGFSLKQHVKQSERTVIERALRDAGGSVTKAAHLLGFKHHQSLVSLLNTRHKELLPQRTTVRKRRRHLFSQSKKANKQAADKPLTSEVSILHVEDNKAVARMVQDMLGDDGMHVDLCFSGSAALEILKSDDAHYDLIVVDNDLPGLGGLEIVLHVRSIAHRRNTPVIMLSGDDCEAAAWRAGVNHFLRKPEGVHQLSAIIRRVLGKSKERKPD